MNNLSVVSVEQIQKQIRVIRGTKVMLDSDLAKLYVIPTKQLNQAVKRNMERFPEGFMFQLTLEEAKASRSQIATLKKGSNIKYLPYAFTEYGVVMLASILNSKLAIALNIHVVKAFVDFRYLPEYKTLVNKVDHIEKTMMIHGDDLKSLFQTLRMLILDLTKAKKLPPDEYII